MLFMEMCYSNSIILFYTPISSNIIVFTYERFVRNKPMTYYYAKLNDYKICNIIV